MTEIHCPHDNAFKKLMADKRVAKDFFKNYLPAKVLTLIDLDTLISNPNNFIDTELKTTYADVLYETIIAGRRGYIYILCEHQSSIDPLMPFRIWQYIIKIWEKYLKNTGKKTLPLVIPIIFYHGKQPYDKSLDIRDLIQAPLDLIEETLFKSFHLIDTHNIANEDLREQCWSDIMTFVFKNIFARDFSKYVDQLIKMLSNLHKIENIDENMHTFIEILIKYLWNVSEMTEPQVLIYPQHFKLRRGAGEGEQRSI